MSFQTSKKADMHSKKVLNILGDKWKGRVWDNLGWHCSWQWGSVTLYYSVYSDSYSVLIGEPNGCGGHMDLSYNDETYQKDPKEAVRLACDVAINVFKTEWKPIQLSVTRVRLSLS